MHSFKKGVLEKEIPTLVPLKKEKQEEAPVQLSESGPAPATETSDETISSKFSDEELVQAWHKFRDKKLQEGIPDSLKMVLNQELVRKGDSELEIFISTEMERKFLQTAEMELVQFLRKELKNEKISLVSTIRAAEVKQRLYTDKEKFNYLSEKQPLLLKLKEKLFLDTDF